MLLFQKASSTVMPWSDHDYANLHNGGMLMTACRLVRKFIACHLLTRELYQTFRCRDLFASNMECPSELFVQGCYWPLTTANSSYVL